MYSALGIYVCVVFLVSGFTSRMVEFRGCERLGELKSIRRADGMGVRFSGNGFEGVFFV